MHFFRNYFFLMLCPKIHKSCCGRGLLPVAVKYRQTSYTCIMSYRCSYIVRYTSIKVIQYGVHAYSEFYCTCTNTFYVVYMLYTDAEILSSCFSLMSPFLLVWRVFAFSSWFTDFRIMLVCLQ